MAEGIFEISGDAMGETRVVLDGLGFPESPRWRDGRVWLCNWGACEVLAVTPDGECEVIACLSPRTLPFSIDWLPDGRLLVIDGPRQLLLRQDHDGTLGTVADLTGFGLAPFNELVVDVAGNAYVNGGPGIVVQVRPDGSVHEVADGLQWPNGMALVDNGRTLVVADSHAEQLVGFTVAEDGTLSSRRVWADLECAPDGICAGCYRTAARGARAAGRACRCTRRCDGPPENPTGHRCPRFDQLAGSSQIPRPWVAARSFFVEGLNVIP